MTLTQWLGSGCLGVEGGFGPGVLLSVSEPLVVDIVKDIRQSTRSNREWHTTSSLELHSDFGSRSHTMVGAVTRNDCAKICKVLFCDHRESSLLTHAGILSS